MYQLHWITDHLATGHAPMSYEDLESIRTQGVGAIVNLCGEFCDLHQIEETSGFEVYYLPVTDEHAPDLEAMEQALDWLDEAIYLGKKVLVHCRMGHGRTGTFVAAYLLRRGFDFKGADQTMKGRNVRPATYDQHHFLKQYGKKAAPLKAAAPRLDNRPAAGMDSLLSEYEHLLAGFDLVNASGGSGEGCGREDHPCCHAPFDLHLIESVHLSQAVNRLLNQRQRRQVIERALDLADRLKRLHHRHPGLSAADLALAEGGEALPCPLLDQGECLVFAVRPPRCRYWRQNGKREGEGERELAGAIADLSTRAFRTLTGRDAPVGELLFSSADTLSGKFVQLYFQAMVNISQQDQP